MHGRRTQSALCSLPGWAALLTLLSSSCPAGDLDRTLPAPWEIPDRIAEQAKEIGPDGFNLFFYYAGVFQGNVTGGESREAAYSMETIYGAHMDLEKLIGWGGAALTISGSSNAGSNLSETIPNVFTVSQAFVTPTTLFYELFLAQKLFDDRLEIRGGRMVSADWFASIPAFGLQVTGGLDGNPTSLFLNSPFTSSPNATWGAAVKLRPGGNFYSATGIYQATDRLGNPAYHGLDFSIRRNDGFQILQEFGWEPTFGKGSLPPNSTCPAPLESPGLPGEYKVGGYYTHFPIDGFQGGTEWNTFGFYWLAQQMLWRCQSNPNKNFSVWAGATWSPQTRVAQMPVMGMAGIVHQGLIPNRDQDLLLVTWLTGSFSREFADSVAGSSGGRPTAETVLDFSYVIQLTEHLFVQPDLQWIIQPNGIASASTVLVPGVQVGFSF